MDSEIIEVSVAYYPRIVNTQCCRSFSLRFVTQGEKGSVADASIERENTYSTVQAALVTSPDPETELGPSTCDSRDRIELLSAWRRLLEDCRACGVVTPLSYRQDRRVYSSELVCDA